MSEGMHAVGAQYVLVDSLDSSRLSLIGSSPISTPQSQSTSFPAMLRPREGDGLDLSAVED